ncbi:hypothetical protein ABIC76_005052 [Ralstonia sp. 1138]
MRAHGTEDELDFITRLYRKYRGAERVVMFRRYMAALHQRTQWGDLDADRILAHAEECLQKAWRYEN